MQKLLLPRLLACTFLLCGGGYFIDAQAVGIVEQTKQAPSSCKGTVVDSQGDPIIGASVIVKGAAKGTTTNIDGQFSLTDVKKGSIIRITGVGYKPVEMTWDGASLDVILADDMQSLDEVVVVGYGVQKKVNLSGAVATVDTKQIENRPVLNVGQALQGTVANLNISIGDGRADASPSFNIRGTTSLNGGSPLVVIDGVISDSWTLNHMNPNDIENISVLKDAASSAIYGSRAAFGVILVTTKEGKSEKLTISYSGNFQARQNVHKPKFITDPYTVTQVRNVMAYPWYNLYNEEQQAYAKKVSEGQADPFFVNPDGRYTYFGETDWVKEAYRDFGFATTHSLSISGKTDRVNYMLSAGYNFTDGIIRYGTDKFNRYNTRAKLNFKLTDWWTLGSNMSMIIKDYDAPTSLGSDYYWSVMRCNPMSVIKNPDGTWTDDGAHVFGRLEEGGRSSEQGLSFSDQFTTKIDIVKDMLWVNGIFAYNYSKNRNRWHYLPVAYYDGPDREPYYKNDVTSATTTTDESKRLSYDAYATFHKTFDSKHDITVVAGFNQENYRYEYSSLSRKELISSSLPTPGLATGDMSVGESISTWATRSGYGRVNYIFDEKYILEFDGRYDGTSRFRKSDRYTFNPSGSVAWVLSHEKFMQALQPVLSFAKVRYSYGTLGNQDVSTYAYITTMGSGKMGQIIDGKQPVYVWTPGLVSGALTWEKVTTSNIGLDLNFFNNRLTFSGDIYTRWTKDMLTSGQPLPNVLGTSVPQENAADLKTKGWEITLGWHDKFQLAGKPFNYNVSFNISDAYAKITKFDNPTGSLDSYYVGHQIGEIWGYTSLGFFKTEDEIKNHADQSKVASYLGSRPIEPGDIKFADLNGDGEIYRGKNTLDDHGDLKIIGNSATRYRFGFNASAEWNNFDFSIFIQGVGKRDYYPGGSDLYFWGIYSQPWTNITIGNYYDRWTEENPDGYFPRFKSYVAEGGAEVALPQTRYLQNAWYARLKNLTFGYTIPSSITRRAGIDQVRLYLSGDNLCTITGLYKHYNVDPESLGGQSYPLQRSYSFGLNVTF